ncbi:hypothetical protein XELAEV_18002814mg [Xenopus laevis]|nr:hypothetical protein XELAEV_18002814mg [Xenopus laevis]
MSERIRTCCRCTTATVIISTGTVGVTMLKGCAVMGLPYISSWTKINDTELSPLIVQTQFLFQ